MTSYDNLDPELAELMALEEAERASATGIAPGQPQPLDPELAELLALEEQERRRQQG